MPKVTTPEPAKQAEPTAPDQKTNPAKVPKWETKAVKHIFAPDERNQMGGELARQIGGLRGVQAEFDQVKASYKAKTTEAEARIDNLSTALVNGFEMRNAKCFVVFRPKDRKKDYIAERDFNEFGEEAQPILTEDMTPTDFQADLLQAESVFDHKQEIRVIPQAGPDGGVLVVGQLGGKWFTALRVTVGRAILEERLDSEQPCFKKRFDAIQKAAKRLNEWLVEKFGKDLAKGFQLPIENAVEGQKDRVE